ncbi:MAG: type IV secretion protein Rhs, partial [Xanthomonas perforans]|nr:type IV secretion protein Rhs [Xanthomonas perforans]
STAWNSTAQTFERVGSDEYGIGAGHWRQTVTTGNAQKITYFDALWQPLLTREYDAANLAGTLRTKRFAYDHEGRAVFASYPSSTEAASTGIWTEFDVVGRPTAVSQDSEQGLLTTITQYLP